MDKVENQNWDFTNFTKYNSGQPNVHRSGIIVLNPFEEGNGLNNKIYCVKHDRSAQFQAFLITEHRMENTNFLLNAKKKKKRMDEFIKTALINSFEDLFKLITSCICSSSSLDVIQSSKYILQTKTWEFVLVCKLNKNGAVKLKR